MSMIEERHLEAVSGIDNWLQGLDLAVERISTSDLARLGFEKFSTGWSMPLPIGGGGLMLLLFDERFPYSVPRIAVAQRHDILLWPHVEHNGLLCIAGDNANVSTSQPIEVVRSTLCEAENLLQQNERSELTEDYWVDFNAYWRREIDASESKIYSLTDHLGRSRLVNAWHGRNSYWVGETASDIFRWFENRYGEKPEGETTEAGLIQLSRLPGPQEYPISVSQLRHILAQLSRDGVTILDRLLQKHPQRVLMVLEGLTKEGQKATAGLILQGASEPRSRANCVREPLSRGFRPGRAPGKVLATRYNLRRTIVTALDSSRTRMDQKIGSALNSKKVIIVGCGSVGASVARILVQSGINDMVLIDPELLGWENLGRHELGAQDVGMHKAEALASHFRSRFPHVKNIDAVNTDLLSAIAKDSGLLDDCDLIISATASWNSESALNDMQLHCEIRCPIIYSWLENRAAAANALAVFSDDHGCFACGFGSTGKPKIPVTQWPDDQKDSQCGGSTSVYGSAELANGYSLTASLSIDILTGKACGTTRRSWISEEAALIQYGGTWNPGWCEMYGDPGTGGKTITTQWETSEDCVGCSGKAG